MWSGIRNRQCQRIAIFTSGTTGTLKELTLGRWHAAQNNRRKIADIDTHFERRCTGQDIRIPDCLRILRPLKIHFKLLSIRSFE